jgi:molybdopterin-guanine dinucleotide biosynthesis protein A
MDIREICAVILAGGQSRRMGVNKALLDVGGQPMIRLLIDRVRPLAGQILISSNDSSSYQFLNFPVVPDQFAECGPLAGFHAAMKWSSCSLYIMLACDLPNLQARVMGQLLSLAEGYDAAIPRTNDGLAHPLCAVYRRTCFSSIEKALQRGSKKVIETFLNDTLHVRWVGPEEGTFSDDDLANINTPEDLRRLSHSHG